MLQSSHCPPVKKYPLEQMLHPLELAQYTHPPLVQATHFPDTVEGRPSLEHVLHVLLKNGQLLQYGKLGKHNEKEGVIIEHISIPIVIIWDLVIVFLGGNILIISIREHYIIIYTEFLSEIKEKITKFVGNYNIICVD